MPGAASPSGASPRVTDTGRVSVARQAKLWQWAALVYTLAASAFFAFVPILPVQTSAGTRWVPPFALLGWGVFLPLLIPVALTLIPILVRRWRVRIAWICTALLGALCLFLALSWGFVFLPAPLIAAVGAFLTGRAPIEDVDVDDSTWKVPSS